MNRLNLTLDADTALALDRYARTHHRPRASLARELLRDALAQREAVERRRKLAADYARGRTDDAALLAEIEAGQLAGFDDDTP